ncbi:O-antigen ligase [uncultured Chloroflexus sp.]|uniref:O-antigen ligase family protein n=1 Tax=uncultured Chloroflexus sp. TaxID=214040 RepID=UPI0026212D6F|nr:O-antigen ligase family protein [uncultured Chloroflexus sp.]
MVVDGSIALNPFALAVLGLVCGYAIWRGRPEIPLALYLSVSLWARTVFVGPIAAVWPLLAMIVLALIRYMHTTQSWSLLPRQFDRTIERILPASDRWIVPWMGLWWGWALCVLFQFGLSDKMQIARSLILYIIIGSLVALLAVRDAAAARRFALTYLLTSVYGLYAALQFINVPLDHLLTDPGLSSLPYRNLGIRNYHHFSHHLGVAFLCGVGLFLQARRLLAIAAFLALTIVCGYGIFLTGARQSLSGIGIASLLIFAWVVVRRGARLRRVSVALATTLIAVIWIYQVAPHLIVREGENGLGDSFNVFADRGWLWQIGWSYFLASPVWGWGFEHKLWSHNLFIGTLADQGLVGMVFFVGYLIWAGRRLPSIWAQTAADDRGIWQATFFAVVIFALVHGQASGNTMSTAHLHWPMWAVWALSASVVGVSAAQPRPIPSYARQRELQAGVQP